MTSLLNRLFSHAAPSKMAAPTPPVPTGAEVAYFAAGCFWGVEHIYRRKFPALKAISVGYIGGSVSNPSYGKVCGGNTGHAEAIRVVYDPEKTEFRGLVDFFYRMHDPTTMNYQGPDHGSQYRSAIYTTTPTQLLIAKDVTKRAQAEWWGTEKDRKGSPKQIVTEIQPAGEWWNAEEYHQRYLDVNNGGYECPSHYIRKFAELSKPETELKAEEKSELSAYNAGNISLCFYSTRQRNGRSERGPVSGANWLDFCSASEQQQQSSLPSL